MTESVKPPSKRQRTIEAAARVFMRFGFARATMGEIAQAAGMSRPALYLLYCSKVEVFEAVVAQWVEASLARIAEGLAAYTTLGTRLRFACETWSVAGVERALANPDIRDMTALPAVRKGYARFEACLTDILREAVEHSAADITTADLAHVIVCAMQGFKQNAGSGDEMRRLIALQIAIVERALQTPR